MLFNSIEFLKFFPVVVFCFFLVPHRFRWLVLLLASYYFYMSWNPGYAVLIGLTTVVSYGAARMMAKTKEAKKRKTYLGISLVANLFILFIFKYFNFFSDSLSAVLGWAQISYESPALKLLLPVGISFYTFQTVGYLLDVYKNRIKPETHFGHFALFVSFFPQLVAGPIERADDLLPQFKQKQKFDYDRLISGVRLMLWGFFLKIVIADRLSPLVDNVYNNPTSFSGIAIVIATYAFAFQIYCDFNGYANIAIGAAKIMGFELSDNFNRPYFATSIRDFWRRWHITLYKWFRDYVYIPLGGSHRSKWRVVLNIMIVFAITGLWHGANWTFVVWGAIHGLFLVSSFLTKNKIATVSKSLRLGRFWYTKYIKMFITFNLVSFAWIFFRANSIADAFYFVTHIFTNTASYYFPTTIIEHLSSIENQRALLHHLDFLLSEFYVAVFFIVILKGIHVLQGRHVRFSNYLDQQHIAIRWGISYVIILALLFFGEYGYSEFIYFQF